MYSGKIGCNLANLMSSGKEVVIRAKYVVFGQKWLYSGKSGCILARVVVFRAKVVLFGQKWLYFGQIEYVLG